MTSRVLPKTEVNKMVKALEQSAKENNVSLQVEKTSETVKISFKGKAIFTALKTHGPWLVRFDDNLFEAETLIKCECCEKRTLPPSLITKVSKCRCGSRIIQSHALHTGTKVVKMILFYFIRPVRVRLCRHNHFMTCHVAIIRCGHR